MLITIHYIWYLLRTSASISLCSLLPLSSVLAISRSAFLEWTAEELFTAVGPPEPVCAPSFVIPCPYSSTRHHLSSSLKTSISMPGLYFVCYIVMLRLENYGDNHKITKLITKDNQTETNQPYAPRRLKMLLLQLNQVKQTCRWVRKAQTEQAWRTSVLRPCKFSTKLMAFYWE